MHLNPCPPSEHPARRCPAPGRDDAMRGERWARRARGRLWEKGGRRHVRRGGREGGRGARGGTGAAAAAAAAAAEAVVAAAGSCQRPLRRRRPPRPYQRLAGSIGCAVVLTRFFLAFPPSLRSSLPPKKPFSFLPFARPSLTSSSGRLPAPGCAAPAAPASAAHIARAAAPSGE